VSLRQKQLVMQELTDGFTTDAGHEDVLRVEPGEHTLLQRGVHVRSVGNAYNLQENM